MMNDREQKQENEHGRTMIEIRYSCINILALSSYCKLLIYWVDVNKKNYIIVIYKFWIKNINFFLEDTFPSYLLF